MYFVICISNTITHSFQDFEILFWIFKFLSFIFGQSLQNVYSKGVSNLLICLRTQRIFHQGEFWDIHDNTFSLFISIPSDNGDDRRHWPHCCQSVLRRCAGSVRLLDWWLFRRPRTDRRSHFAVHDIEGGAGERAWQSVCSAVGLWQCSAIRKRCVVYTGETGMGVINGIKY